MKSLIRACSQTRWLILLGLLLIGFNILLAQYMPSEHALDLQFAYSPEQAYDSLSFLDAAERSQYGWAVTVFDMPYLVAYALFFSGLLYRLRGKKGAWLLPALVAFFDLLENLSILYLLKVFPEKSNWVALVASFSSTSKWVFVFILLTLVAVAVIKSFSKRNNPVEKAIKAKI
ncbi:MAG: hypothetical protein EP311_05770 [Cytophagales bacterium]|nr:MAG: hypothetical protein EP311_05770 [Cytophagales bacterium]